MHDLACMQTFQALLQDEQVEYLDDSEVDFSSDDDEEDMEDFDAIGAERLAAAPSQRGKRPPGQPFGIELETKVYAFIAIMGWLRLS